MRGMDLAEEFRIGPIFHSGLALSNQISGDRQYYLLELRGESPNHGFSRIFLRTIALYELLSLPNLQTSSDSNPRQVRMHHQFFSLGFESPVFYEWSREQDIELGWTGGFTLAKVTFKEPQKTKDKSTGFGSLFSDYPEIQPSQIAQPKNNPAQQDAQFMGGMLGGYSRYYGFFPFVPYSSVSFSFGNFLDKSALVEGVEPKSSTTTPTNNTSTVKQRIFQAAPRLGLSFSAGLDYYLFSRGLLGLEYSFWNWDINQSNDYTHFLSLKAGILF